MSRFKTWETKNPTPPRVILSGAAWGPGTPQRSWGKRSEGSASSQTRVTASSPNVSPLRRGRPKTHPPPYVILSAAAWGPVNASAFMG